MMAGKLKLVPTTASSFAGTFLVNLLLLLFNTE